MEPRSNSLELPGGSSGRPRPGTYLTSRTAQFMLRANRNGQKADCGSRSSSGVEGLSHWPAGLRLEARSIGFRLARASKSRVVRYRTCPSARWCCVLDFHDGFPGGYRSALCAVESLHTMLHLAQATAQPSAQWLVPGFAAAAAAAAPLPQHKNSPHETARQTPPGHCPQALLLELCPGQLHRE